MPSRTAKKFDTDEIIDEFHTAGEGTDATGGDVSGQAIKFMSSDAAQQVRDITIQSGTISTGDTSDGEYSIKIGAVEISMIQARNALSKAVSDAVYGRTGIMTTLNGGTQLKLKTGLTCEKIFSAALAVRYLQFRKFML